MRVKNKPDIMLSEICYTMREEIVWQNMIMIRF